MDNLSTFGCFSFEGHLCLVCQRAMLDLNYCDPWPMDADAVPTIMVSDIVSFRNDTVVYTKSIRILLYIIHIISICIEHEHLSSDMFDQLIEIAKRSVPASEGAHRLGIHGTLRGEAEYHSEGGFVSIFLKIGGQDST